MNKFKRLWTRVVRFVEALEGMDDPIGNYMFAVGKRVEKLERDLDHLKSQPHSRPDGGAFPNHADSR